MPQAKAVKFVKSFVKGLVTEAGYLTYPEDASTDELNTELHVRGNRTRRRGIDFEPDSTVMTFPGNENDITQEFFWRSADNNSDYNFLVLQVNNMIYFYDASVNPLSDGEKSFTINLNSYKSPTATQAEVSTRRCNFAAGKGYLFIVQEFIDPISVEYDTVTDTISPVRIIIQTRDFDGVNDGLANDAEPTFLSAHHHYNLRNQGWVRTGTNSVQTNYPVDPDVLDPVVGPIVGDVGPAPGSGSGGTGGGTGTPGNGGNGDGGYGSGYDPYTGEPSGTEQN